MPNDGTSENGVKGLLYVLLTGVLIIILELFHYHFAHSIFHTDYEIISV